MRFEFVVSYIFCLQQYLIQTCFSCLSCKYREVLCVEFYTKIFLIFIIEKNCFALKTLIFSKTLKRILKRNFVDFRWWLQILVLYHVTLDVLLKITD